MSDVCLNPTFFNGQNEVHLMALSNIIRDAYKLELNNVERRKKEKREKKEEEEAPIGFSTLDFYSTLMKMLKNESTPFYVEYSGSEAEFSRTLREKYLNSLLEMLNSIIELIPKKYIKKGGIDLEVFLSAIREHFMEDCKITTLRRIKPDIENFTINLEGANHKVGYRFNSYVNKVYGDCFGAKRSLGNRFSRDIFMATLCDLDSGKYIVNTADLNRSIALYKNKLYKRILKFLKTINPGAEYSSEIYTNSLNINTLYYEALRAMREYISNTEKVNSDVILSEYDIRAFGGVSEKLDAIDAYFTLTYFDDFLKESLGDVIKYNHNYKNLEVKITLNKYLFSRDASNQRKSWNDSDSRTSIQNSTRFTKFVLNSIPLFIDGVDSGKPIGIGLFTSTITKLFENVSKYLNIESKFVKDVLGFDKNSPVYASKIIRQIAEDSSIRATLASIGFTESDFGVIDSLYRFVFSFDSDIDEKIEFSEYSNKSLRTLEYNQLTKSFTLNRYSIMNDIIGAMDDCMAAAYLQVTYGEDGGFDIKVRERYKDRRATEKYKGKINQSLILAPLSRREHLNKTAEVEFKVGKTVADVKIPMIIEGKKENLEFSITNSNELGVLELSANVKLNVVGKSNWINELRSLIVNNSEFSKINLDSYASRLRLIEGKELTKEELLFRNAMLFIEERLKPGFWSTDGLKKFKIFRDLKLRKKDNSFFDDLLIYATKVLIMSDIYLNFEKAQQDPNSKYYKSSSKAFVTFLVEEDKGYKPFTSVLKERKLVSTYFYNTNGIYKLRAIPSSTNWVEDLILAQMILQGDISSSVSKNQSGTNDANYMTPFLGGKIFLICYQSLLAADERESLISNYRRAIENSVDLYLENDAVYNSLNNELKVEYRENLINKNLEEIGLPPQLASSALLFTENLGAIEQVVINLDVKKGDTVKKVKDLNPSELFYNAIIHNFWGYYVKSGNFSIQPTTFSDKPKQIQYAIKAAYLFASIENLNTNSENRRLFNILFNVSSDLDINEVLKNHTEESLQALAAEKGITITKGINYTVDKDGIKILIKRKKSLINMTTSDLIELYRTSIGKASRLALENTLYKFLKIFGLRFSVDELNNELKKHTSEDLAQLAFEKGVEITPDLDYRVKKVNGKEILVVSEVLTHLASYEDSETLTAKLRLEETNFINNLVDSGVNFWVTNPSDEVEVIELKRSLLKSTNPIAKILLALDEVGKLSAPTAEEKNTLLVYWNKWVKNGKLVLAYNKDGNIVQHNKVDEFSEVNPLLEQFFYTETVLSNNLRFHLTGFESNHPDKSYFSDLWNKVALLELILHLLLSSIENIQRVQKANIIWGHPSLGKTTYSQEHSDRIIEFDAEFKEIRDSFIAKAMGRTDAATRSEFLKYAYNYLSGAPAVNERGEKNYAAEHILNYEGFKTLITLAWSSAKQKALELGKKLFASPAILLTLFSDDFDLALTITPKVFLSRIVASGEVYYPDWKQNIDALLNNIKDKVIDVGDLYVSDVMALADGIDLYELSKSSSLDARTMAERMTTIVENISQSTLLKRNVIIPATAHKIHPGFYDGCAETLNVAIVDDIKAWVYNFSGKSKKQDSADGSALVPKIQTILENNSLMSQEVGQDRKPIWYHYDQSTGTSSLMKFAAFEVNNLRALMSRMSRVSLMKFFKKTMDLAWANLDDNGKVIIDENGNESWNTTVPIELGMSYKRTGRRARVNIVKDEVSFANNILREKPYYYKTYTEDGEVTYKRILGFGGNFYDGYYTIELEVDETGDAYSDETVKVYHFFDKDGKHYRYGELNPEQLAGKHSINSLYELWLSFGSIYSLDLVDRKFRDSDESHYVVVSFMNHTTVLGKGDSKDFNSLSSYIQPLKKMYIAYVTNQTGMKNGAANVNPSSRWSDDKKLTYLVLETQGLGIQMDAEHNIEDSPYMTEFSQVITALESGGVLHKYVKQIYYDLGKVAVKASSMEIEAVAEFLLKKDIDYYEAKNKLYELLGRIILNLYKSRDESTSLTLSILNAIEKEFNVKLDHSEDLIKMPTSDANIYNLILPIVTSLINRKSIKRQFPGTGFILAPGYDMMLYFRIGDTRYLFTDLVEEALNEGYFEVFASENPNIDVESEDFEVSLVESYLKYKLDLVPFTLDIGEFIPTDIVDIYDKNGEYLATKNLEAIDDYYHFHFGWTDAELSNNTTIKLVGYKKWEISLKEDNTLKFIIEAERDLLGKETGKYNIHFKTGGFDLRTQRRTKSTLTIDLRNRLFRSALAALPTGATLRLSETTEEQKTSGIGGLTKGSYFGYLSIFGNTDRLGGTVLERGNSYIVSYFDENGVRNEGAVYEYIKTDLASTHLYKLSMLTPRNLSPVRITYRRSDNGHMSNVFNQESFIESWMASKQKNSELLQVAQEKVQEAFKNLKAGFIIENGQRIEITELENAPAELISSNIYGNLFSNFGKSMILIEKEGPDAFKINYDSLKDSDIYDLAFTRSDGKHTYISFTDSYNPKCTYEPYDSKLLYTEKDNRGNIDVWLISEDSRKLFKVGRYVLDSDYTVRDGKIIHVASDKEISLEKAKRFKQLDGVVYKYLEFVSMYKVVEPRYLGEDIYSNDEYYMYYINEANIADAFNIEEYKDLNKREKLQKIKKDEKYVKQFNHFITNILEDLFELKLYSGILFNKSLNRHAANSIIRYVNPMRNLDSKFRSMVMRPVKEILELGLLTLDKGLNLLVDFKNIYETYYTELAREIYSSWKLSAYFTCARIPAQTLQSFMQMRNVAYAGFSTNVAYVSHWQFWLQGSDLDIDKGYIMGFEFGDDGKLVKWSNLFDYSSEKTLKTSLKLPTPKGIKIRANTEGNGINIDRYIEKLKPVFKIKFEDGSFIEDLENLSESDRVTKLQIISDLLIDIYDLLDSQGTTSISYTKSKESNYIVSALIRLLDTHEYTRIPVNLEEAAYKNSISSSILNVVLDPENMDMAYLPITMDDLQNIAKKSKTGELLYSMSMMNPLTKYLMQSLNMVGKDVIGISAVAEKVFFNLSYYWNEGVRRKDKRWIKYLQFSKRFDRILGRYKLLNAKPGLNFIQSVLKTTLADVNFTDFDEVRLNFVSLSLLDDSLRQKYRITDLDIELKTINWEKYNESFKEEVKKIHKDNNKIVHADLMISQVLSAATDNAKELILKKINCNDKLAKCHLSLIMLGFDIKDIVSFMINPAILLVSDVSDTNMFDSYLGELRVEDAVDIAEGNLKTNWFLSGYMEVIGRDWDESSGEWVKYKRSMAKADRLKEVIMTNSRVRSIVLKSLEEKFLLTIDPEAEKKPVFKMSWESFIKEYIDLRSRGVEIPQLSSVWDSNLIIRKALNAFSEFTERVIYMRKEALKGYKAQHLPENEVLAYKDYLDDLDEFRKVFKLANETSNLGSTLLGMNQGLPGIKSDLEGKIAAINSCMTSREKAFGIEQSKLFIIKESEDPDNPKPSELKEQEKAIKAINTLKDKLLANNEFLTRADVDNALKLAVVFDIIGNFNIENWLLDKKLTKEDIVNNRYLNLNIDSLLLFDQSDLTKKDDNGELYISYRDLISEYYNVIKDISNIFDVVLKVPQYEKIIDLLKTVYVIDKYSSTKSALFNIMSNEVRKKEKFLDKTLHTGIIDYINDLLVSYFIRKQLLIFPVLKGDKYLGMFYESKTAFVDDDLSAIDLTYSSGRASFKKVFEDILLQLQTTGKYGNIKIPNFRENEFLQGLTSIEDERSGKRSLGTELDMSTVSATPESEKKYLQYISGFKELSADEYKIGDLKLSDWIIIYNLIVNQNRPGSDRFTSVLRNSGKGTILETYLKFIGNIDYSEVSDSLLKELKYDLDDLLIRIAPYVPYNGVDALSASYVRTKTPDGVYVTMRKTKKGYKPMSLFPTSLFADSEKTNNNEEDSLISDEQRDNYIMHQTMPMRNLDMRMSLIEGINSKSIDTVRNALIIYSKLNILHTIYKC